MVIRNTEHALLEQYFATIRPSISSFTLPHRIPPASNSNQTIMRLAILQYSTLSLLTALVQAAQATPNVDSLPVPKCFQGTVLETLLWCQQDNYCCNFGLESCHWTDETTTIVEICQGSCMGIGACTFSETAEKIHVSFGGCLGTDACNGLGIMGGSVRVDTNSCQGEGACCYGQGSIGAHSCHGLHACGFASGPVGHDSCRLDLSCHAAVSVGDCVSDCPVGSRCPSECVDAAIGEKEEESQWMSVARRIFGALERSMVG